MSRLRRDVEALNISRNKSRDYDPEDEVRQSDEGSVNSDEEKDSAATGREHYEKVGKSRLRKPDAEPLAAKYGGVAVSRQALQEDVSDDDPFGPRDEDFDDEDPFAQQEGTNGPEHNGVEDRDGHSSDKSNDVTSESGSERSMLSVEEHDGISEDEKDDDETDESQEEDATEDDNDDEDSDQHDARPDTRHTPVSRKRDELRTLLSNQAQSLASGLSQAANADVKKGQAVKKQYQTFDRLLDARIKLQKGLLASAELVSQLEASSFGSEAEDALLQAQQSALGLFNTITAFRSNISHETAEQPSKKRKKLSTLDSLDDLDTIWDSLADLESESRVSRRRLVDKWSRKVKASDPTNVAATSRSKFLNPSQNDHLTAVLDTYIINEQDKHFRTQQTEDDNNSSQPSTEYDDNLFYQSLLRDLIATRAATSSAANDISLTILPHKLHPSGNKQNKKKIDTRASKGRKIRYTVHEKLQNFMAAEGDNGRDTAMWTERGKNEFFGSLFGQDRALAEEEDDDDNMSVEGVDGAEGEALRLFRT